ncbi:hypothetical protein LRP50_11340 [Enterovibrio sp. ZSDZ42]|uniref:Uncharacterized protein n=1 Tax=Enterovibrio gelatinilyticus TaxID=2899819 RepID=A0ABT5R139_9GAMM|nr:hypothetical protein [Enterovibrio sp. ZSDZ42]MDD1793724.1 hypothetical protein [Enterovibrio sp. ZSDZ42]
MWLRNELAGNKARFPDSGMTNKSDSADIYNALSDFNDLIKTYPINLKMQSSGCLGILALTPHSYESGFSLTPNITKKKYKASHIL